MYKIGDKVVYGSSGVCEVSAISTLDSTAADRDRLYYVLKNLSTGGTAYVPTDSEVYIRAVMSESEAKVFLAQIPNISFDELLKIPPKECQKAFRDILSSHDGLKIIGLIKFLKHIESAKRQQRKKLSITEERYLSQSLLVIESELMVSLGCSKNEVEDLVSEILKKSEEN